MRVKPYENRIWIRIRNNQKGGTKGKPERGFTLYETSVDEVYKEFSDALKYEGTGLKDMPVQCYIDIFKLKKNGRSEKHKRITMRSKDFWGTFNTVLERIKELTGQYPPKAYR